MATPFSTATDDYTRPANTTAYADNDAVSDSTSAPTNLEFTTRKRAGRRGVLMAARLIKSTATSTDAAFDLVLFEAAPTAFEDNAAFDPSDTEAKTVVGVIEFASGDVIVSGNNAFWTRTQLEMPFKADADGKIYGALVARAAYAPGSAEVFTVELDWRLP